MTEIDILAHDCSEGLCSHPEHQNLLGTKINLADLRRAQKIDIHRSYLASEGDPKVLQKNFEVNNSEEAHMYEATRFDD